MNSKLSPYQPVTPELAASGMLVPIKQAAADESACETTLKANAKARRLPAYQAYYGAPVMVLPAEVQKFLKARPDIASKHHPKHSPAVCAAGSLSLATQPQTHEHFPFADEDSLCGPVGDFGIAVTIRSLGNTFPSERGLVAKCLLEIARQINETIPAEAGSQSQH